MIQSFFDQGTHDIFKSPVARPEENFLKTCGGSLTVNLTNSTPLKPSVISAFLPETTLRPCTATEGSTGDLDLFLIKVNREGQ